jgi:hypothetical protein
VKSLGRAAQVTISPSLHDGLRSARPYRTVGAHLAKIYAKLGATSRVQLHD